MVLGVPKLKHFQEENLKEKLMRSSLNLSKSCLESHQFSLRLQFRGLALYENYFIKLFELTFYIHINGLMCPHKSYQYMLVHVLRKCYWQTLGVLYTNMFSLLNDMYNYSFNSVTD